MARARGLDEKMACNVSIHGTAAYRARYWPMFDRMAGQCIFFSTLDVHTRAHCISNIDTAQSVIDDTGVEVGDGGNAAGENACR